MSQTVSLVLSSGGARGYAHIGVIEALEAHGFSIHAISGSSMGAVVGGVYAAGGMQKFKEWACNLERSDVFKLYDFVFSSQGFMRGERVFRQIENHIPDCNIEDLKIPFKAIATDLTSQKEMVFTRGSLYNALRASSAIPAVVKPAELGELELLDGGILSPLPVKFAERKEGDLLVAVDVNANIPYDKAKKTKAEIADDNKLLAQLDQLSKKWFGKNDREFTTENKKKLGFFDLMMKSIDMMQDRITEHLLEQHPPDLLISISRDSCSTFDYYKAQKMIDEGREALEKALKAYQSNELA